MVLIHGPDIILAKAGTVRKRKEEERRTVGIRLVKALHITRIKAMLGMSSQRR